MPRPDSLLVAALLTLLVAFGPLSTDLYLPSLPMLTEAFDAPVSQVQLTLSVFLVAFGVSQLIYGSLSDRFGRRPVLIGGIVIYSLASTACFFADSIETLILGRFFQALGACSGVVLARAVVRDVYGRERAAKVIAYMAMAMALAPAVAPIIGGVLTSAFGWRSNFLALLVIGLAALSGVFFLLQETNQHKDPDALRPGRIFRNFLTLLRSSEYRGYVIAVAAAYSGIFSFISGSSFVFISVLGLTPDQYGLCFGAVVIGYMGGSFAAGRLTVRLGIEKLVLIGAMFCAVGGSLGLALAAADVLTIASLVLPMIVFLFGCGLVLPNAIAGAVGPFPKMAGAASSLVGFFQMGTAALVGVLVGHSDAISGFPMYLAIFVCGCGALMAGTAIYLRKGRAESAAW